MTTLTKEEQARLDAFHARPRPRKYAREAAQRSIGKVHTTPPPPPTDYQWERGEREWREIERGFFWVFIKIPLLAITAGLLLALVRVALWGFGLLL